MFWVNKMKERLDIILVNKSIVDSRSKAQDLIKNGKIYVNGNKITKSSYACTLEDNIEVRGELLKYVSRGGLKLEGALKSFDFDLSGKKVIDIGSSTGGFTDCCIQNGASKVIAVDVGTNQMHSSLLSNPKLELHENTDIRNLNVEVVKDIEVAVIDTSFISVTKFVPIITKYPNLKSIICLIKPQFECGKDIADKYKGIILDKKVHFDVIKNVTSSFKENNFYLNGLASSSIRGGDGNIEYVALFEKEYSNVNINFEEVINFAFKNK